MTRTEAAAAEVDVGLRQYMLRVYNYMASGLALTGLVAAFVANTPAIYTAIFGSPLMWVAILAPVALVFFLSFRIQSMSPTTAQAVFWVYAALNGVAFATIFLQFTGTSIARVFFITAATFGAMSLWGYTTKRDLTSMGAFLFAGLIGILVAMLVNLFLQSSALQFAISVIGVVVFVGLTAFDTQRIKEIYFEGDEAGVATKKSIMGALTLYLDFINIFIMLMQLFGDRK